MDEVETIDNWEDLGDDSEILDKQFEKLRLQKSKQKAENGIVKVDNQGSLNAGAMMILENSTRNGEGGDESARSQPEPKISILSRPKVNGQTGPALALKNGFTHHKHNNNNNQPVKSQNQKTLEQREKEYAEARKRILGDVRFEEEEAEAAMETMLTPGEILRLKVESSMKGEDMSSVNLIKLIPTSTVSTSTTNTMNTVNTNGPSSSATEYHATINSMVEKIQQMTSPPNPNQQQQQQQGSKGKHKNKNKNYRNKNNVKSNNPQQQQSNFVVPEQIIREFPLSKLEAQSIIRNPRPPIPGQIGFNTNR